MTDKRLYILGLVCMLCVLAIHAQQSSVQIVNGHTSSFSSITFTYTLYAEKAGNYTIGGAHARVAGHKLVSRPIHLKVSGASRKNGNAGPNMHDEDGGMQLRDAGTRITAGA